MQKKFLLFLLVFVCVVQGQEKYQHKSSGKGKTQEQAQEKEIKELSLHLTGKDRQTKLGAIKKLQKIGPKAKEVIPTLVALLQENDREIAKETLKAIITIEPDALLKLISKKSSTRGARILGTSRAFKRKKLGYKKLHALVIGINDYQNLMDLEGANFDAAEVASVMVSRFAFENVILMVDKKPTFPVPKRVKVIMGKITKNAIYRQLQKMQKYKMKQDAFLFFYAGHGVPKYLVPADASTSDVSTMLAFTQLVKEIRKCDAHHTLLVLDCCFSGSILERDSKIHDLIGQLEKRSLQVGAGDNLSRVFNRRAFQIITAGTGDETVGDQILQSAQYAKLVKDQGHSPFTAVFLQALQGLTGRPDGRQLVSELGYYMNYTLVNDKRIAATQAPKYGALGDGDGDFIFFPAYRVLNPKLVAPLYLDGKTYSRLRQAACRALYQFIKKQPKNYRVDLTRSAIAHVARLLQDKSSLPKKSAIKVISDLALYAAKVEEFRAVIAPISRLLRKAKFRDPAAMALGRLSLYANKSAVVHMKEYIKIQKQLWQKKISLFRKDVIPAKVKEKEQEVNSIFVDSKQSWPSQMKTLDSLRSRYHWLFKTGVPLIEQYEQRIKQAQVLAEKGEHAWKNRELLRAEMFWAKSLTFFDNVKIRHKLIKARDGTRLKWSSGVRERCSDIAFVPKSNYFASVQKNKIHFWNLNNGHRVFSFLNASSGYLTFSDDGTLVATANSVWNIKSKQQTKLERVSRRQPREIVFSQDKQKIAMVIDKNICIWHVPSGKKFKVLYGHSGRIRGISFNKKGDKILSTSSSLVSLWDVNSGTQKFKITRYKASYFDKAIFSPDSKKIVMIKNNQHIFSYDANSGKKISSFKENSYSVSNIALSPDGKYLAVIGSNALLRNLNNNKIIVQKKGTPMCFSSDSSKIVVVRRNKIEILHCLDGSVIKTIKHIFKSGNWKDHKFLFDPSGKFLALLEAGEFYIWHIKTGKLLFQNPGHKGKTKELIFSPNSEHMLISGAKNMSGSRVLCLKETMSGKTIFEMNGEKLGNFSKNSQVAAFGSYNSLILWDIKQGKNIELHDGHSKNITSLAFDQQNRYLLSGGKDGLLCLWEWPLILKGTGGQYLRKFTTADEAIDSVAIAPDASLIACASAKKIYVYSTLKKQKKLVISHSYGSLDISFSANKRFVMAKKDHTVYSWDIATGKLILQPFEGGFSVYKNSIVYKDDLVILAKGNFVQGWDIKKQKLSFQFTSKNKAAFNGLRFSHDKKIFALNGGERNASQKHHFISLRNVENGKEIFKWYAHRGLINNMQFSPDSQMLVSSTTDTLSLWKLYNKKAILRIKGKGFKKVTFSPDSNFLAVIYQNGTIELWDLKVGQTLFNLPDYWGTIRDLSINNNSFDPKGKLLACGGKNNVHIWNIEEKKKTGELIGHTSQISQVKFSPNGKILASLSGLYVNNPTHPKDLLRERDSSIRLWDAATGQELRVLRGYSNQVFTFNPGGTLLAFADEDKTMYLWDFKANKIQQKFIGHSHIIEDLVLDKEHLMSASFDGSVCLWDIKNGLQKNRFSDGKLHIYNLELSKEHVLAGSGERYIKDRRFRGGEIVCLWDTKTQREIGRLKGSKGYLKEIAFGLANKQFMGISSKNFFLWDIKSSKLLIDYPVLEEDTEYINSAAFGPNRQYLVIRNQAIKFIDLSEIKKVIQQDPKILLQQAQKHSNLQMKDFKLEPKPKTIALKQ